MHLGIFGVFCISATQSENYCTQIGGESCNYGVNCIALSAYLKYLKLTS